MFISAVLYVVGIIIFAAALGHHYTSQPIAFMVIGAGIALAGLAGALLTYLDGSR